MSNIPTTKWEDIGDQIFKVIEVIGAAGLILAGIFNVVCAIIALYCIIS